MERVNTYSELSASDISSSSSAFADRNIITIEDDDEPHASPLSTTDITDQGDDHFLNTLAALISGEITQHVHPALQDAHTSFAVEYLNTAEDDLVADQEMGELLQIASDINAPHGDPGTCKAYVAMHWPPLDDINSESDSDEGQ